MQMPITLKDIDVTGARLEPGAFNHQVRKISLVVDNKATILVCELPEVFE